MLLVLFQSTASSLDVWELLHSWYDDHLIIHLAGGFHADQAPGDTVLPYAVETCITEIYSHDIGAHEVGELTVQISIFHTDRGQLESAKQAWITSLRDFFATLRATDLDGSQGDNWDLSVGRRRLDPDLGPDGQKVWIQDLEYTVHLSKDL